MQKRHLDRKLYFCELADTSREFYLDYLSEYLLGKSKVRVLEIGCGEAGNLLPFAEKGCDVVGIDLDGSKIEQAKISFSEAGQNGLFICDNFITMQDQNLGKFDIILVHDVIEHIHQQDKLEFMLNIKKLWMIIVLYFVLSQLGKCLLVVIIKYVKALLRNYHLFMYYQT